MAGLTAAQRLAAIAELKARGEDVSGLSVTPPPVDAGANKAAALQAKADQDRVNQMQQAAALVQAYAGHINDFAIRNARTPTGHGLAVKGATDVAKSQGTAGSDELGVMDNDAVQAALALRTPGLRITGMEFQKFLGGTPSTTNDIKVNQPFQHKANVARVLADAQASFYDNWNRSHHGLAGADNAWSDFYQNHFDPEGTYYHDPTQNPYGPQTQHAAPGYAPAAPSGPAVNRAGQTLAPATGPVVNRAGVNKALRVQSGLPVVLGIEPAGS